ncbi:MAG: lytic transglycosylase [Alphaproteobacteria bacterium PA2]|nr:MAG: lytic transglycosylase [Alphaproteobacteria bacterium PA2]
MGGDPGLLAAPLFDQGTDGRTFVPTAHGSAGARSRGQGRPIGRRGGALPLTGASPLAGWIGLGTLLVSLAMPGPSGPLQAQPARAPDLADHVHEASLRFKVPERWITAVMRVESGFDARATSPVGAMGLMQVMPRTYQGLRLRYGLGADPYQPRDNILAGAAYLREMYDRYGSAGFLAAYNAGPGRYEAFLIAGRPLPLETRAYVAKITPRLGGGLSEPRPAILLATAPPGLFVQIGQRSDGDLTVENSPPNGRLIAGRSSLFAPLSGAETGP